MLSKKEGNKYVVLPSGERFPVKISKKKTDQVLGKIEQALKTISTSLTELYDTDCDLYNIVRSEVFDEAGLYCSEGCCGNIDALLYCTRELQISLNENSDVIPEVQDITTLEDIGYEKTFRNCIWEKILEDTDEREVVEEILLLERVPIRRTRTTLWQKTDYGKSSTKITYKKLRMTKRLEIILNNTVSEQEKRDGGLW